MLMNKADEIIIEKLNNLDGLIRANFYDIKRFLDKKEKPADDSIFNQEMFDFFINEHDLTLTSGQMYDIIHFVNSHYPLNIDTCSDDELYNIFNKIVNEMNRRKEKRDGTNG